MTADCQRGIVEQLIIEYLANIVVFHIQPSTFNLPVAYCSSLGVEINAYFYDRQTSEGKLLGVVLEVYLVDGCLSRHIEFQLEEI